MDEVVSEGSWFWRMRLAIEASKAHGLAWNGGEVRPGRLVGGLTHSEASLSLAREAGSELNLPVPLHLLPLLHP